MSTATAVPMISVDEVRVWCEGRTNLASDVPRDVGQVGQDADNPIAHALTAKYGEPFHAGLDGNGDAKYWRAKDELDPERTWTLDQWGTDFFTVIKRYGHDDGHYTAADALEVLSIITRP